MKPMAENHEKHLYNGGALISMVILWYCAISGMGSPEAIAAVFGVFLFCTLSSLARKLSKYHNGKSFLDDLKTFSVNRDGVTVEMKGDSADATQNI